MGDVSLHKRTLSHPCLGVLSFTGNFTTEARRHRENRRGEMAESENITSDNELIQKAIQDGIRKGIADRLSANYGPVAKQLDELVSTEANTMLAGLITECFAEPTFRDDIARGLREQLSKSLVRRFGGDLERTVNNLKSDPKIRQQIVDALDKIVQNNISAPSGQSVGAGAASVT
jgi:hypothetical protein